jgi:hypothetical protein
VGKFVVGQPEGSEQHIPESAVPEGLRFPALFHGEGVRGHRYHVFDAPRYVCFPACRNAVNVFLDTLPDCSLL